MKDAVNYFIPIVEDPMNDITGRCITHHASTNGYYGYQPVVGKEGSGGRRQQQQHHQEAPERMETGCDVDIQFNNCMEPEEPADAPVQPQAARKRVWDYDADMPDCKRRRENEPFPFIPQQPPVNKSAHIRQPTHNIPDMPRCMMGHYI